MKNTAIKNDDTLDKSLIVSSKKAALISNITAKSPRKSKGDQAKSKQQDGVTADIDPTAGHIIAPEYKGDTAAPIQSTETDETATAGQDMKAFPPMENDATTQPETVAEALIIPQTTASTMPTAGLRKPARNLDQTIEILEDLTRKKKHRDNLLAIITKLEAFETELQNDPDPTNDSNFSGCTLTIKNAQQEFSTSNANLIHLVAQYIKSSCADKLAQIEATIVIPD